MEFETYYLHGPILLAGFAGGLCHSLYGKKSIKEALSTLVTATLTANYCYELYSHWLGAGTGTGFAAFTSGVVAPLIIRWLLLAAQKRFGLNGEMKS